MRHRATVTLLCNRISAEVPVRWDRLVDDTEDGGDLKVYGWIERECEACTGSGADEHVVEADRLVSCPSCHGSGVDRRSDFILVRVDEHWISVVTSSDRYSAAVALAAFPSSTSAPHVECQRVEDVLPGVEAAIKL